MDRQRLKQRISDFQQAAFRLEQACRQEENEFIRDSVIQRFEFCYELAWKMLKLKLEDEGIEARTPKEAIQKAVTAGLIADGNLWTELQRMRNQTSHTYDEKLAREVYAFVRQEGLGLFKALVEESRRWLA